MMFQQHLLQQYTVGCLQVQEETPKTCQQQTYNFILH